MASLQVFNFHDILEDFDTNWIRDVYIPNFSSGYFHEVEKTFLDKTRMGTIHSKAEKVNVTQIELFKIMQLQREEYRKYKTFYNKIITQCDKIANKINREVDDIALFVGYDKTSKGLQEHTDGVDVLAFNLFGNTTWVFPKIDKKAYLEQKRDVVLAPGNTSHYVIPPEDGIRLSVAIILL